MKGEKREDTELQKSYGSLSSNGDFTPYKENFTPKPGLGSKLVKKGRRVGIELQKSCGSLSSNGNQFSTKENLTPIVLSDSRLKKPLSGSRLRQEADVILCKRRAGRVPFQPLFVNTMSSSISEASGLKATRSSISVSISLAEDVIVKVESVTNIATTDDNFVCATIDWWPADKCNYNQCPWEKAGLFNLDFKNKILSNAIKAFSPLRIRIGGSLQDQILYKVGKWVKNCPRITKTTDGLFGFSKGCLTMKKWNQINHLVNKTGAVVTFGLNALIGRTKASDNGTHVGDWDSTNARDLIKYTVSKGYNIDSWELGNELCGTGISANVDAKQYARDAIALRKILNELYQDSTIKPKLLAPGGFFDQKWFSTFLQASGPDVVDIVTHHIYNLGPGDDPNLIHKIQDPLYLDQINQTYKDVETTLKSFRGHLLGLEKLVAHTTVVERLYHTPFSIAFGMFLKYLDQLGMTSTFNHKTFCRQSLIGGNYGLLNTTNFVPNPDYYNALLWHKLMGKNVLRATHNGSPHLRVYSHCSRTKPGITLLLINMSNSTSFDVSVVNDVKLHPTIEELKGEHAREEYHLTPKDGNLQSNVMLLNGSPLVLTKSLGIPAMNPVHADRSSPIRIAPDSIVFATLRDVLVPACA
ncbi:hypothetical protein IFM89_034455 [Coptis chinensis]|uniref:Heparanase-like protein 2 n=1 Tax=Coptis chinensis TaxID=261450 RepID=A0A835IYN6_9MAGN|nr:hypothetical protein IFM89_034455 [Coptis chinensis]